MVIVQVLINYYDDSILWIIAIFKLILCQSAAGRARFSDSDSVPGGNLKFYQIWMKAAALVQMDCQVKY